MRYVISHSYRYWLSTVLQVRLVQKIDTGKIYAMKLLKKDEMLKKDQVPYIAVLLDAYPFITFSARSRTRRTGRFSRVRLALGGPTVLLFSRSFSPLPNNGIPSWRRLDDNAHQVRHVF